MLQFYARKKLIKQDNRVPELNTLEILVSTYWHKKNNDSNIKKMSILFNKPMQLLLSNN